MTDKNTSSKKNEITTYLEYANLQIAAEAFIGKTRGRTFQVKSEDNISDRTSDKLNDDLVEGNWHSSKFSKTLAGEFVKRWKVVRHIGNTGTGFSGTLFEAIADNPAAGIKKGQQVLSFRSTEFVDDAVRDSRATNELEIKEKGFAFGQISDMKEWIDELRRDGAMKDHITVTGYSLGGHLATALYQLQSEGTFKGLNIDNTYTFNGAGIGKLLDGAQLKTVIEKFSHYRKAGTAEFFTTKEAINLYNEIKEEYGYSSRNQTEKLSLIKNKVDLIYTDWTLSILQGVAKSDPRIKEISYIKEAVDRLVSINNERLRIKDFTSGKLNKDSKETKLLPTHEKDIAGLDLDYQIGVVISSQNYTEAYPKFLGVGSGLMRVIMNNKLIEGEKEGKDNFYDIIGKTYTSMVAVSQKHFGKDIRISIEDQPLGRGYFVTNMLKESILDYKDGTPDLKLLVDKYDINAFGDTHSLVLIVDSLLAHNTLLQLDNNFTIDTFDKIMPLLSNVEADTDIANKNQGVAEGDALENLVNHLIKIFNIKINDNRLIDISPDGLKGLRGDLRGGTWNKVENVVHDDKVYHGREALHATIQEINKFFHANNLSNKFLLASTGKILPSPKRENTVRARSLFGYLMGLKTLSPFIALNKDNDTNNVWKVIQEDNYKKWDDDNNYIKHNGMAINFSDNWIEDRSLLLYWKNILYKNNKPNNWSFISDNIYIRLADLDKRIDYKQIISIDDEIDGTIKKVGDKRNIDVDTIQFGSSNKENPDYLKGKNSIDHLYGELGNDTLEGGGGADYMEGGEGYDTYIADKEDTILDSDGKGEIHLDGKLIKGTATRIKDKNDKNDNGTGTYTDEKQGHTYSWGGQTETTVDGRKIVIGSDLVIDGGLTIKNFRNGDLGIHLENQTPPPEPPPASPPFKDPLSLDLDGDGQVNTLPRRAGVHFDLDNSGFAEQTAWLAPGDGFLVLDRNNNGHIDGGAELFGSETTLNNGKVAENGFEALAEWDSNADGKITAEDAIYHRLRIWQDKNSNGVVNSGELNTLQAHGIAEIHLDYQNGFWDVNDIRHREIGHFTRADGTPGDIHTLWFDNDPVHSVPVENQQGRDVEIPAEISALPDAKGFGNIYPLRYAMALDKTGTLQKLVTQFVQEKDPATRHALTDQIMARWTGKENVTPGSRGVYADAGQLAILEAFWGSVADERDLNWRNGDWIKTAYKQLHNMVYRQLASQTHYKALYGAVDFYQDENVWRADMAKVNQQLLQAFASGMMSAEEIHDFLINTVGGSVIDNETLLHDIKQSIINDAKMLPDAKMNSLLNVVMHDNDIITGNDEDNYIATYGGDDQVKGMAGNDTINTGSGNDKAYGGLGDDTLYGGEGDDYLDGGEGNDTVYGGEDDDVLRGEDGADIYVFKGSWGKDTIYDYQSENRIRLEDCSLEDIRFSRINGRDLLMRKLGTENEILIKAQFSDEGVLDARSITQWEFADGRVLSSAEVNKLLHQGTDGDDVMEGDAYDNILAGQAGNDFLHGNDGNDEIDGGDGDDHLHGDGGDDQLDGGNGNDTLDGGRGNDRLNGGDGNDTLDGGDGADILAGGKGDDSYIIGDNDTVILGESMGSDHLHIAKGKYAPLKNVTIQLDIPITPEQVQVIRKDFNDAVTGVDDYSLFNPEMPLSTPKGTLKDTFSEIRYMLSAHLPSLEKGRDYLIGSLGDAQDWKLPKDRAFVLNVDRGIPFDNAFSQWTRQDQYYLKFDTVSKHYFTITPKPGISNDLLLNFSSAGQLTIDNGLSGNLYGDITLSFKNGSKMSISELLQRQLDAAQTDGNDVIRGFASNDYLRGGAGNDILQGGEGDDSLEGGVGDDILSGGYYSLYWNTPESIYKGHYQYQYQASKSDRNLISGPDKYSSTPSPGLGNDTYIFSGAFGHDTVIDCDETKDNIDTLWFKDIASLEELNFRKVENNLVIATKDNRSSVTVINQFSKEQPHWGVESIKLSNGQAMKLDDVFLAPLMTKGSEHDDVLVNTSNQDIRIDGYAGNDTITSGAGNDTINGGDGNDTIDAGGGDDIIDGGNGDDRIDGGAGNDIITGGSGNDNMTGGDGDDEFIFSKGWGQDYIWSTWTRDLSNDVIRFTDVTPDEISLRQQMGNIILSRKGSNDFISLRGNTGIISKVIFADGSEWNTTKLLELSLSSTEDADTIETDTPDVTIRGGGGDDVINARNGTNNRLYGDAGNDTISGDGELYGGDGNDSLFGMGKLYGEAGDDSLRGGSALYGGDGNDVLFLYRKEPGDTRPLYGDGGDGDDILRTSGVPSAYGEGVGTVAPSKGESVVTLRGGKGNDTIHGSYDNEVYEFSLGDGHDVIIEREAESSGYYSNLKASWDVLRFGSGIKAEDIHYLRQGKDLLIRHKNGTDSITVQNFFYIDDPAYHHYRINEVQFADGTTHTDSDIDRFVTQGSHQGNNKNSKMAANVADFSGGQHSRPMASNVAPAGVSADVIDQTALHHAQNLIQAMSTFDQRGINADNLISPDDSNVINKIPLAPSL